MMPSVIYVDIDEVLADWTGTTMRLLGFDPEHVHAQWSKMSPRPWDIVEVLATFSGDVIPALTHNRMWRFIDEAGEQFWADVKPLPWMHELLDRCSSYAYVTLLSSPSLHPSSHSGKAMWIQKHFGRNYRDYLLGSVKHRVAHPGALLIDDSPKNCELFREFGGQAILFPGVGNDLHAMPGHERVDHVMTQLRGLL